MASPNELSLLSMVLIFFAANGLGFIGAFIIVSAVSGEWSINKWNLWEFSALIMCWYFLVPVIMYHIVTTLSK